MRSIVFLIFLILLSPSWAWARESSSYKITSEIIDSSGGERSSAAYKFLGIARELKLNAPGSSSYMIQEGFIPTLFQAPVLAVLVTSISPNSGYNTGLITITDLSGSGFNPGATVRLARSGETDIQGINVNVASASRITCAFDLNGKTAGLWNVVVANTDGKYGTLPSAFNIMSFLPTLNQVVNTPNPFNPLAGSTAIAYQLAEDTTVSVLIFNTSHELLFKQDFAPGANGGRAGANSITWNGYNSFAEMAPNGVYFCQVVDKQTGKVLSKGKIAVSR
jgi:hypothetical protein